jgi:hypothetical protein
MAITPVVVMMMRKEEAARRSGGRGQRRRTDGGSGGDSESQFAKHGRSPLAVRVRHVVSARAGIVSVLPIANLSPAREQGFASIW